MRVVFFGTPELAATILENLLHRPITLVAVVSRPDKPKGRSRLPQPTAVKEVAERYGLPLHQPHKVSSVESEAWLRAYDADLFVVVAYAEILKRNILALPKRGSLNVHGSRLPKYRGAAPVQRALMAGERETAVSIMALAPEMDAGDVYAVAPIPLSESDTAGDVLHRMADVGAELLWEVICQLEKGTLTATPQEASQVTFAPKVRAEEGEIDWRRSATVLHNHIRGLTPNPGAWCWVSLRGVKKRLNIKKARVWADRTGVPGQLWIEPTRLLVGCGEGVLELLEVQLEGKKALPAALFVRGIDLQHFEMIVQVI